jgi:hypothetical protein
VLKPETITVSYPTISTIILIFSLRLHFETCIFLVLYILGVSVKYSEQKWITAALSLLWFRVKTWLIGELSNVPFESRDILVWFDCALVAWKVVIYYVMFFHKIHRAISLGLDAWWHEWDFVLMLCPCLCFVLREIALIYS